ncbi:MAG: hypothetical protein AAF639_25795 [Chloroflexota bacterium]
MEAKTLRLHVKVSDRFQCRIFDQEGEEMGYYDGYVPRFFPGDHFGDYLIMEIDLATGQIINWNAPDEADIERLIG